MEKDAYDPRLSQISTQWTLVFQLHKGEPGEVSAAQEALILRYAGAVHRYLLAALRDPELAADLDQEFALRFLRGDFHRADPASGRFRDFVKRSLRNLMINHLKSAKRRPLSGGGLPDEPAVSVETIETNFDVQFSESWRKELMSRAWSALLDLQTRTGQPYHSVLRCRVDHPELRSADLAVELSRQLGRELTANNVRQALLRARDKFVAYLLEEVSASLRHPSLDDIENELIDLGLLEYCRPSLDRMRGDRAKS